MMLVCPQCSTPIPADKINMQALIAVCPACHQMFEFGQEVEPEKVKSKKIERPKRVHLKIEPDHMRLSYDWFTWAGLVIVPTALFWNAVTWTLVGMVLYSRIWFILLFISGHVALGLWMMYSAATTLFNHTAIQIDEGVLTVQHGPFPARGNKTLNTPEIEQLFYKQSFPKRKLRSRGSNYQLNYELFAALSDGTEHTLFQHTDENVVRYIGQKLRRYLNMHDEPERVDLTQGRVL